MQPPNKIRLGLAAKLAICVIASTAAFFALFGYLNLRMERTHSEELIKQSAYRVADVILRSTHYEMLHNDRDALHNIIRELGSENGIRRIRLFNKEGRITLSSEAGEIDTVVDKNAEACYGCHQQSAPLTKLNRKDRARRFTDKDGRSVLAVIQPVDNAPECSNAACHVHPAEQQVLGVIDANLSLDTVDVQMAQHQANLAYFLVGAIRAGFRAGRSVHLDRGVPPGQETDHRHAPRGGRRPVVSPAGGFGRRTGRPGALLQQDDRQGGRRAGGDRRARAPQDGRTGEDPQDAAEFGEDGVHRQAGGHRGARDQQSAVRHPDLRAPDAARRAEAGFSRARRDGGAVANHRAREQALRRTGQESADVFAPGAEPARAAGSEHRGAPRGPTGEAQAGHAEHRVEGDSGRRACRRWIATATRSSR